MIKCGITGHGGNLGSKFISKNKNIKFYRFTGNISNKKHVNKWIKNSNFENIIHLAAIVPTKKVEQNYKFAKKVNYQGTKNLIDSILMFNNKINWFFFASTSHVYALSKNKVKENNKINPVSKYGKTKLFAENYIIKKLNKEKVNFCIGRIFSVYDNRDKSFLVSGLKNKILKKKDNITLKDLNHFRDFVTTNYISKVIIFLMKKKYKGIVNIGSGKKTHLKKIAIKIAKKYKKKIKITDNYNPTSIISNINKLKKIGFF